MMTYAGALSGDALSSAGKDKVNCNLSKANQTKDPCQFFLQYYTSSNLYDCTFNVGFQGREQQIFKCHKVILANASQVFQEMFCAEDGKSDSLIPMENVTPVVFDQSMRFVYGKAKSDWDVFTAIEIFQFAYEMRILHLLQEVENYLEKMAYDDNIFAIFDMFNKIGYEPGSKWCWEMISEGPWDALLFDCWENVSSLTVMKLLSGLVQNDDDLDFGNFNVKLFDALVRWGTCQVRKQKGKTPTGKEVREMINDHLKFVKFLSMTSEEFAQICSKTDILTTEEKYYILLALTLDSKVFFPEGFFLNEN